MELGQHIMVDKKVIKDICDLANLKKSDTVFEIGAGPGNLTSEIARRCRKVIAVEIDRKFEQQLNELASKSGNVEVRIENVLKSEIRGDKVIGNLPYDALEPIFRKLCKSEFKSGVLTVSKRFAEKLRGDSVIGLLFSAFFEIVEMKDIQRSSFEPEPDTDSVIIIIRKRGKNIMSEMFSQDDKKVKNALREAYVRIKNSTKRDAKELVDKLGLRELCVKTVSELKPDEIKTIQKRVDAHSKSGL